MTVDLIIGTLTPISANFINPYTGEVLSVNGTYFLNDTLVTGGSGTNDIALGVTFDQFWRLEDELGNLLIENIEVFLPAPGDDILLLSSNTHILGDLTIQAAEGNDVVWSNAGNDLIEGGLGNDILHGGPGHDTINGDDDQDELFGATGDDILTGGTGNDQLSGGADNDTYIYNTGDGDDIITETSGFDTISFGSGITINDITFFQNGKDLDIIIANGITVKDFYSGDADKIVEQIVFSDNSTYDLTTLLVADVDDTFLATSLAEHFDGEGGNDTVDYSDSYARVVIDLENNTGAGGYAYGDTYESIENIIGADVGLGDYLYGDSGNNHLMGLGGNDILEGGAGADILDGGSATNDYARYTRSDEGVTVNMETNINTGGDAEGDILIGIERLTGSQYADSLTGDAIGNYLRGEKGEDFLDGGAGADYLYGGNDNDVLYGGAGSDIMYGQYGADTFLYGANDTFGFVDKIRDFSTTSGGTGDKIDISDLLIGYDPLADAIGDFVSFTSAGSTGAHGAISIDVDGGADNFVLIAYITNQPNLDAETLETSGNLITV